MSPDEEMAEWLETCRGCMGKSTLMPIREDLRTKFFESTSIMVSKDDGLPSYLCLDCLDTINYANQFKKGCLKIDACLRRKLVELRAKIKAKKSHTKNLNPATEVANNSQGAKSAVKVEKDDEDCYYVVIINENEKGEKIMQTVKMEAGDAKLPLIKQEIDDEHEDGQYIEDDQSTRDIKQLSMEDEQMDTEDDTRAQTNRQLQISEDGQLNLIQVLTDSGEAVDGEMVAFSEYPGDAISGYTQEEVVVGNGEGDYEVVCNGADLEDDDEDEETITVTQQLDGSFLCDCGESFMEFDDYENHIKTHNIYSCSICSRGFESKEIVQGHMLLHSSSDPNLICPFCFQLVKRNVITTHIKINHNEARPSCAVCEKSFANEHNLKRHMVIHSGEKKYECDICGKRFNQKVSMKNHRILHLRDNGLNCEICLQLFTTEEDLAAHQDEGCKPPTSGGKNGEKPFSCLTCGKQYLTMASLRNHTEFQHNSPSVELLCSECGEVLPSRKAMYAHAYTHRQAKSKNLKRFACNTCGKGCSSHAMLLMHERVHTNERPFQCTKCALAFKTKTHLTTHQLTHTQEKRFGCSVCMKFFALKGNLVVHLRTHTGERPYVCSLCNQAFIDSKYLKKHKQRRHDIANIPWNQYY